MLSTALVQSCSSIAEGVTRGLTPKDDEKPPRPCEVTGSAFQGLSERLRRLELSGSALAGERANPQRFKVMMVHGIGTHPPGFSAHLQRNLTQALGLTRRDEVIKELGLRDPERFGDEPLGHLRILRYMNETGTREILFYELSWSEITTPDKATLAYDTSGEYAYRRSDVNQAIKVFLNDRMADSIAYFGKELRIYMLANQLPLLELGSTPPPVVDRIDAYCKPGGSNYDDRYLGELSIVEFSDPNDALSYPLPTGYEHEYMDSRLCPQIVNVSINVVDPINFLGMTEFVNPMAAHDSYENDERVIGLMVGGIGQDGTHEKVAAECTWLETVD